MSRWRKDPDAAAAALLRRSLPAAVPRRILLANQSGPAAAMLSQELMRRGARVSMWNRRVDVLAPASAVHASPWPPPGPFDLALLRLPRSKDEQEMAAHACFSVLERAGNLNVYGGNDEGIRSAARALERLAGGVETLAVRGHGRVLSAPRPPDASRLRTPIAAWRRVTRLALQGNPTDWVSYPGTFAAGRLDPGTALFLTALPSLAPMAQVLDYGCGTGPIGFAVARQQRAPIDMMDADSLALEAVRENVPAARRVLGARLADAPEEAYDAILSNPPLHRGGVEDHTALERLIAEAPQRLKRGGILQLVVQRRVVLERHLAAGFGSSRLVAQSAGYRVWRAARA
jgi:16S rRNA (guanine1207-N2)-methyltransferase